MRPDHIAKIDDAIRALLESMHKCWGHYHLLRGIHEGSKAHPKAVAEHDAVLLQIWRSTFEALFVAAGTLLDKRKDTASISTVITLVRKLGTPEVKSILPALEAKLSEPGSGLEKIRVWRNNAVAHWSSIGRDVSFYEKNQMKIDDVEHALLQIEEIVNEISWHATSVHNTIRPASASLVENGILLLKSLEAATNISSERGQTTASDANSETRIFL